MELRSVEAIVRALNSADVRYLIVGGLAVNAHGYVRLTVDVDLVVALEFENIVKALRALKAIDYHPTIPITPEQFANRDLRERWRRDKQMLVLKLWSDQHRRTGIDVFVEEPFPFDQEYRRAVHHTIVAGVAAPIVSYATLLEMKAAAGRPKDLLDIEALRKLEPYR